MKIMRLLNKNASSFASDSRVWDKWWSSKGVKKRIIGLVKKYYFDQYFADLPVRFGPEIARTDIILECGCGQAGSLAYIRRKLSCRTVGLDLSMKVASTASKHCDYFVSGDIFCLPFSDKSVNVIFNQGVMEHFTNNEIRCIFKEFGRVCRKKVVVCVPAVTSLFRYIYNPFEGLDGRFMSRRELLSLMDEHFVNVGARYLVSSGLLSMDAWGEVII